MYLALMEIPTPRPLDLSSEFTSPAYYQLSYGDKHNFKKEIKGTHSTQNRKNDRILKPLFITHWRKTLPKIAQYLVKYILEIKFEASVKSPPNLILEDNLTAILSSCSKFDS